MRALQVKVSSLEQENLILKECLRGAQLKHEDHSPLSKEVFMCCDGQDNITLRIPTKQTIIVNNFEKECQTLDN